MRAHFLTFLCFSLAALIAFAQPTPINRRAVAIAGLATTQPSFFAGIGLAISNRWIADITSTASVQDWLDTSNNVHLVQNTANNRPTNSANGLWFGDGTNAKFLVGTNMHMDNKNVTLVIYELQDNGLGEDHHQQILVGRSSGALAISGDLGGNTWGINSGNNVDQLIPLAKTNNIITTTTSTPKVWTNGVSTAASPNFPDVANIGGDAIRSHALFGWIQEIIIFTNQTVTSSQVSNLNWYATHRTWPPQQ